MVDRSQLEPAVFEFVVMADTHYVLPEKSNSGEFETRRFQTARIGQAVELARHLDPKFVIHLGDLVQEFPGTSDFSESLRQAKDQLDALGITIHHAAGNHDVGDKPDPTTAAPWTTDEFLDYYHHHVAPSWFDFTEGDVHFIVLNTSVMNNTALAAEAEQWRWLEETLEAHAGMRTVVSYHIPAYVMGPSEPSLGHYDNVAEPARSRLIDLFDRYEVDFVFQGHSHFAFVNDRPATRLYVVPSTSTTRPGFCELFSSAAPPAQGHNDADKLGLFLVRVYADDMRINFLRTQGSAATVPPGEGREILLTGTPRELATSQLGVTLRHPLANYADVPITFPSTVRQPVRNDYPLLGLLELGARSVRIPGSELEDDRLRPRHEILRSEGMSTVATFLWEPAPDLVERIAAVGPLVDGVEIQVPGDAEPTDEVLASFPRLSDAAGGALSVCQVTLAQIKGVQMHRRQRFGYKPTTLGSLDSRLAAAGAPVDRAVCHIDDRDELWELVEVMGQGLDSIRQVDVLVEVGLQGLAADSWLAAEAVVALAPFEGVRIFVDTLVELDRTMDMRGGLLNRMCNPRPSFRVLQTLNTVVHGRVVAGAVTDTRRTRFGVSATTPDGNLLLVMPGIDPGGRVDLDEALTAVGPRSDESPVVRYELATGWVHRTVASRAVFAPSDPTAPYVIQASAVSSQTLGS
jgi:predicted phosphodiesterase